MSARDREHDKWIAWYVEDTPGWLQLSLAARGAMEGIARKLNDKTGVLVLRRGLPSLALLLGRPWPEIEPALSELISNGKLVWNGSLFQLSDPEYGERRRRTSADRMAIKRSRDRQSSVPPPPSDGCDVTSVTVTPVTVSDGCSSLVFSDLISSGSDARDPPAWFGTAIGVVEMGTGVALPVAEAWLRYEGHRAGKGIAPTTKDAQYWLTTVMVPEARELLRKASRDKERDEQFRRDKLGTPPKPQDSRKAFAERDGWAKTAGAPDLEAQARLNKLLGKVGT